jgi:hypothetical protein
MNESITRAAGGVDGQQTGGRDAAAGDPLDRPRSRGSAPRSTARSPQRSFGDDVLTDDVEGFHRRIVQA